MRKERDAVEASQGEPDRRIFRVLLISITAAALLAVVGYFYVLGTDDEEIAEEPVRIFTPEGG